MPEVRKCFHGASGGRKGSLQRLRLGMGSSEEMKWSILTLTMPTRVEFLRRLTDNLGPQLIEGVVEWRIRMCDFKYSLGENREMMRRAAPGEYSNFVDDDDRISDSYVETILPLLDRDYVGFQVQAYEDDIPLPGPTYHSLLCGGWFDKTYADGTKSWHRDISHLNPIRRELALVVPMYGGFAEDSRWAGELRALGIVKTERYIDKEVMYHYLSRPGKKDGVQPGPVSAGTCPWCESTSTVLIPMGKMWCNRCGRECFMQASAST